MNYFNYIFSTMYSGTVWLYNLIFAFTTILAFAAQKRSSQNPAAKNIWFFLSFLIAWFFFAFNKTGADLPVYIEQYGQSSLTSGYITAAGLEMGYRLLIAIFHTFIKNPYVGIGILKTIQLSLVFVCIYKLRDKISVGYAIMAYMSVFYFASFNVFRISLAGSLVLLSYVLLLEKKMIKSTFLVAIACTIHNSVLVYALALMFYFCYLWYKRIKSLVRFAIILAVPVIVFFGRSIIISILQSGIFMDRYIDYAMAESTLGIMQFIFYLPVFYILINDCKSNNLGNFDVNFVFTITGFIVALVGYSVGILSRVSILFSGPLLFYIPQYMKLRTVGSKFPRYVSILSIIMVVYWIVRYIISIGGYLVTSGLYPFQFVF